MVIYTLNNHPCLECAFMSNTHTYPSSRWLSSPVHPNTRLQIVVQLIPVGRPYTEHIEQTADRLAINSTRNHLQEYKKYQIFEWNTAIYCDIYTQQYFAMTQKFLSTPPQNYFATTKPKIFLLPLPLPKNNTPSPNIFAILTMKEIITLLPKKLQLQPQNICHPTP